MTFEPPRFGQNLVSGAGYRIELRISGESSKVGPRSARHRAFRLEFGVTGSEFEVRSSEFGLLLGSSGGVAGGGGSGVVGDLRRWAWCSRSRP